MATAARSKNAVASNGIFGCAEARFYDANNRTWLAMDPIKDGGNDHDLPAYLERADFSDPEELKLQFGDYSDNGNVGIMLRRADELDIILYGEYERNYEDYMRHGDIWAKLSGT